MDDMARVSCLISISLLSTYENGACERTGWSSINDHHQSNVDCTIENPIGNGLDQRS